MIQKSHAQQASLPGFARLAALVLAALILSAALISPPARAAEWMTPYLEQVQEWGVMRGDSNGNLHEDRSITRAEFVTLVNRAFGYTEVGPHTFTDVNPNDWYAEDISIAHQAGYFQGTSPTTASPLSLVTREQAAVLLGRCLRFQGVTGAANSTFTDMRDIGGWSRGLVQECADLGIIQGYSDGTFKPNLPITRGQMACFLVRALGTLIQEPGEQTSGGVYGNLTITVPGVKLKDTTITGNLYLTGGVGLGNVELENVNVLGKIIVSGSGEAERGDHSILLRNVTAASMDVDSLAGQFLSIQAEGLTDIGTTTVRSSAFIQDLTEDGLGLRAIRLDGEEDAKLQLAGNIKDVTNLTPSSSLEIAQGVAKMVTIDERALDSKLAIDDKASIVELNLDRGIPVTGPGSISHLNVNAEGASVEMLPDTLKVRPGIIANVNKVNMNNIAAAESSEDPRILAGYPLTRNVAPTSAEAVFRTNKTGTIHWGLTALMDGSLGEEELMNPSNYSSKIIRSGTVNVTASNTDVVTRLTGLTKEGSYYVSAVLVDARGRRSTVKVAAFTTPDDTAPNFATGYPQAPILTTDADNEQIAQIMVMPTKDCQMYYVLLPKGSTAPTAADFRSAALPGNLGFGIVTLRKNTPFLVSRINSSHLQEQTDYDLYLWLNDADNGKSSTVRRISLRTKDLTPPTIQKLEVKSIAARSVTMTFALDEPGALYWAVVKSGQTFYVSGVDPKNPNDVGKIQIENGSGSMVVRRGGPVRAARGATDYTFTVSGLDPQTTYDLYYVAKDTAGNYCVYTQSLTPPMKINTLDGEPPTVTQEFENDATPEGQTLPTPYPNTDIRIVFSESVVGYQTGADSQREYNDDFLDAYRRVLASSGDEKAARERELAEMLKRHIKLFSNATRLEVPDRNASNETSDNWVLDYRKATVYIDDTTSEMIVSFPYDENSANSAVNLASGETYYFVVSNIADTSDAHNLMKTNYRDGFHLPQFTTMFATIYVTNNENEESVYYNGETRPAKIFLLTPENTESVSEQTRWDMAIWTDFSMDYQLLVRREGDSTWTDLGRLRPNVTSGEVYNSLNGNFSSQMIDSGLFGDMQTGQGRPHLRQFTEGLEFAIVPNLDLVQRAINMKVQIFAGTNTELSNISIPQGSSTTLAGRNITAIGDPNPFPIVVSPPGYAPEISVPHLGINPGSIATTVQVTVKNRPGRIYYMAIPLEADRNGNIPISGTDYVMIGASYPAVNGVRPSLESIPTRRVQDIDGLKLDNDAPDPRDVVQGNNQSTRIRTGSSGQTPLEANRGFTLNITGLDPETTYILYLVSTDVNDVPAEHALCYKFTTTPPSAPRIAFEPGGNTTTNIKVDMDATLDYILVPSTRAQQSSNPFGYTFGSSMLESGATLPSSFHGTVLDAMLTPYPGDSGTFTRSIFDACASAATKQLYAGYIVEPNAIFVSPFEPAMTVPGAGVRPVQDFYQTGSFPLTGMKGINYYTLIVAATAKNSESIGFRASRSYYNTQSDYLYVRSCSLDPDNKSLDKSLSYTGTMEITFSQDLYYLFRDENNELAKLVDTCDKVHTNHALDSTNHLGSNDCVNLGYVMNCTKGVDLISPTWHTNGTTHGPGAGNTFEFQLTNASANVTKITFSDLLCGPNRSVRGTGTSLTVTLRKTGTGANTQWYLEWPDEWNRATD